MEVIYEVIWKQILPNVIDCIRSQRGVSTVPRSVFPTLDDAIGRRD
jgi:hypothetical protein